MGGFIPPPMNRQRAASIADLLQQRGQISAQRAYGRGNLLGGAIAGLGQAVGGAIEQHRIKKEGEERQRALQGLFQDPKMYEDSGYAMQSLVNAGYEPESAFKLAKGFREWGQSQDPQMDPDKAMGHAMSLAQIYDSADPETQEALRPALYDYMKGSRLDPDNRIQSLNREQFNKFVGSMVRGEEPPEVGSPEWLITAPPEDVERLGERERLRKGPDPEKEYKVTQNGVTKLVPGSVLREGIREDRPTPSGGKLDWALNTETGAHEMVTPEEIRASGGRYTRPLWAAQGQELERVQRNIGAFTDINTALSAVTDKIGPVTYTWNELKQKLPEEFAAAQPAFRAFQQQLNALTNEEIKRITGAQMSAQEADRLKKGMADGSLKLNDLKAALYIWERSMRRTEASLMGRLDQWQQENPYDPSLGGLFGPESTAGAPGSAPRQTVANVPFNPNAPSGSEANPIVLE